MEGRVLKEKLRSIGTNFNDLADRLGYQNRQTLHSALSAKDVKSGIIERIAAETGKPISWFYGETSTIEVMSANTNSQVTNLPESVIALLQKKDEQIDRLLTIIEKTKLI